MRPSNRSHVRKQVEEHHPFSFSRSSSVVVQVRAWITSQIDESRLPIGFTTLDDYARLLGGFFVEQPNLSSMDLEFPEHLVFLHFSQLVLSDLYISTYSIPLPLAIIFSALLFQRAPTLLSPFSSLARQGTGTSSSLNCSAVGCLVREVRLGHCTAFLGGLGDPSLPYAPRRSKRRNGRSGSRCFSWAGEGEGLPSRKGLVTNSEYKDAGEHSERVLTVVEGTVFGGVVLVVSWTVGSVVFF
jgi:hypothetical protein